jgi:hypothetical protein
MREFLSSLVLMALIATPALACETKGGAHIPPLAVALDALLPQTTLADAELVKVKSLRSQITKLAAVGKQKDARAAEEQAMAMLGYRKAWLKCGPGTFAWMKRQPPLSQ